MSPQRYWDTKSCRQKVKNLAARSIESLVDQYLDFAERQARHRKVMYMADWKAKLDAFLELNDEKILTHAGAISAEMAKELALSEYAKFEEYRRSEEAIRSEKELQEALQKFMLSRET